MSAQRRSRAPRAGKTSGPSKEHVSTKTVEIPLNRVEGDLEITVDVADGVVTNAHASGTMFRGFEGILAGRGALDGLVITPRICGICSTSHLLAAVSALDRIAQSTPPPSAIRLRNALTLTEHIQSDVRQGFITFAADFASSAYAGQDLHEEAVRRYEPFKGETVLEAIQATRHFLEIVALLAGQWPHSSSMVPGGVVSTPTASDLLQCRALAATFRRWYEKRVLGCSLERWREVTSGRALDRWLSESPAHRDSDLGLFIRLARARGLTETGRGPEHFLSFGCFDLPDGTQVASLGEGAQLLPAGFAGLRSHEPLNQEQVNEHVAASWYEDYEGGRHPMQGLTRPYASGHEGTKYSWAKAPRYGDRTVEVGPLAEMLIAGVPLVKDLVAKGGVSTFVRQLARIVRPTLLIPALETWLGEIEPAHELYVSPGAITDGEGVGLAEAARGALGHWVRVEHGKIAHYQIITPTSWNASPRDSDGHPGAVEQALLGTAVRDPDNAVELGHVVRSFDPCLVCSVHVLDRRGPRSIVRVR